MQMLVALSLARKAFPQVGLCGDLVEHAIGVCDPREVQRKRTYPNRLCGGDVIPMNSLQ
jgi:hypothetical protein